MRAVISGLSSYLPKKVVTNAELARTSPDWSVERIAAKTGIHQRHLAQDEECASDLAFHAAQQLFANGCEPNEIDYLLLCTQSPDYLLPTTACLLQERLGIPQSAGAMDFNLGCSGYIYGLGLAQGLIGTGQASRVLLLTADTYSKFLNPEDRSAVTIFGDGATATLIGSVPHAPGAEMKAAYIYGTDGAGASHLILRGSGTRQEDRSAMDCENQSGFLYMNGPEIFSFALRIVPDCAQKLLAKTGRSMKDIDLFVFHQANQYMLSHLRDKLGIPDEKFFVFLAECGNTVSSTIPVALEQAFKTGKLKEGQQVMLLGFGVGLSWGATLLTWPFLGCSE